MRLKRVLMKSKNHEAADNIYQLNQASMKQKSWCFTRETSLTACLCVPCHRITRTTPQSEQKSSVFGLIAKDFKRKTKFLPAKNKAFPIVVNARAGSSTFLDVFNVISRHISPTDARSKLRTMETWITALNLTSTWSHCKNGTEKELSDEDEVNYLRRSVWRCWNVWHFAETSLAQSLTQLTFQLHNSLLCFDLTYDHQKKPYKLQAMKPSLKHRTHLEIVVVFWL